MRISALDDRRSHANLGIRHILTALPRLIALRRERRALLQLDDHLLRDIGLTREAAVKEAALPLWDAPASWRR